MKFALAIVAAAFLLSGCGSSGVSEDETYVKQIQLPDGQSVDCVVLNGYHTESISCDWNGDSQ